MTLDPTLPDELPTTTRETVREAIERLSRLTVENRTYALNRSDLPDGMEVYEDRADLPYVVDGERPLFSDSAVAVEGDDVRLAVEFDGRKSHWKEEGLDLAARAYEEMEAAGIARPNRERLGEPRCYEIGVQFGDRNVAVENVIVGGAN